MSSRARAGGEAGFTTIELLIAVFIAAVGVMALVGTLDMSRRLTSLSEMKEAAAHIAQQEIERIRTLDYDAVALDSTPASASDPAQPGYYVGSDGGSPTYRWNQKTDAGGDHTDRLVVDAAAGRVQAAPTSWRDGRLSGKVHRYVTEVDDPACDEQTLCEGVDFKRVTVAVTVANAEGPKRPVLISSIVTPGGGGSGSGVVDGGANPLSSPDTKCNQGGTLVSCTHSIDGTVRSYYLYDTPATASQRQEISGSHPTHPTVAPTGTCTGAATSGCPVPDLMGGSPPPSSSPPPAVYSYSNEVSGGSWPGGAVIRRDTGCAGTPSSSDNTKGHLWVTAPLSSPMKLTGDAALSLSTATFNGVSATVKLCVRFYDVPGSIANLVAGPPATIGTDSHTQSTWPTSATPIAFAMDFRGGEPDYTIASGRRLGLRIWVDSSSQADIAAIYDHQLHPSFLQINEAD